MTHNDAKQGTAQKLIIPLIALALLLLMVAWLAGYFNEKISPVTKEDLQQKYNMAVIDKTDSYTVNASKVPIFESVAASIEAKQATIISSRILARIDNIHVRAGDTVKQGDLLIQLEQGDLKSQVLQREFAKVTALKYDWKILIKKYYFARNKFLGNKFQMSQ